MHLHNLPNPVSEQVLKACYYAFLLALCHASVLRPLPETIRRETLINFKKFKGLVFVVAIGLGWQVSLAILAVNSMSGFAVQLVAEFLALLVVIFGLRFIVPRAMNMATQQQVANMLLVFLGAATLCLALASVNIGQVDIVISLIITLLVNLMLFASYWFNAGVFLAYDKAKKRYRPKPLDQNE